VRMLQAPTHYGVTPDEVRGPVRRRIIIHSPSQNCTALFEDRQQELLHCHLLQRFLVFWRVHLFPVPSGGGGPNTPAAAAGPLPRSGSGP